MGDRRYMEAIRLLRLALHLRMYGENAPGGNETWRQFDSECETYLRSIDADIFSIECPNCESNKLSLGHHIGTFYLGCDECSETVKILTPDDVLEMLERSRAHK